MLNSALTSLLVVLISTKAANAWFRVACTDPLVTERVDPIISPNITVPSNHVHTVHGAKNFASTADYNSLRASSCTSCEVSQDLSNYWFPKLYFRDPQAHTYSEVANGGLLVYYQNRGNGDVANGGSGLKAFPPGFKMISGSPTRRSRKYTPNSGGQGELAERAIQWTCLRYNAPGQTGYDSTLTNAGWPNTTCEAGFQARVHMPACWDGVNLDSPSHTTHTAFLDGLDNGACPDTHPVYLMKLFYEITWNVQDFASRWTEANGWPFVWATGDPTGFSLHADFQNGWDTTALQNAIDKCNNPNDATGQGDTAACTYLTVIDASVANECKLSPAFSEQTGGNLTYLPGCNPLQYGPGDSTIYSDSNCPGH